jgi:hypothetical protein
MSRRALGGLLLGLWISLTPSWAEPWKKAPEGDGYISSAGLIMATASPQPAGRVLSVAKSFLGLPYVWAGTEPTAGFDCSGYTYEVMRLNGYEIPRMADEQFEATRRVAYKDLQPGDLVFFTTYLPGPSHVGFYLGEGEFIHASSAAEGVVASSLASGYYRERFLGGGRPEGWKGGRALAAEETRAVVDTAAPPISVGEVTAGSVSGDFVADEGPTSAASQAVTPGSETSRVGLSHNPFARDRGPQPVLVSVVPEIENAGEAAFEEWKLVLGETLALGRLHLERLLKGLTSSLS